MSQDAMQGMLFAGLGDEPDDHSADVVLKLCSLNVNSPSAARAEQLVAWLVGTGSNVLVLTELQQGDGTRLIRAALEADGYETIVHPRWRESRYHTLVAGRGFRMSAIDPVPFDPRVVGVDLTSAGGKVRLLGVYGMTNGMSAESSERRKVFQRELLSYVAAVAQPDLCVAGDLNLIEPGHRPPLPAFEDHDYACYLGLLQLGLRDAYRTCWPAGEDHSWSSPRYGSQRLDHVLIGNSVRVQSCAYDHTPRHGSLSDHSAATLVVQFEKAGVIG